MGRRMVAHREIRVGQKFDRLTVIDPNARKEGDGGRQYLLCRCQCGTKKLIRASDAVRGAVRSCGCFLNEARHDLTLRYRTHGMTRSPEFRAWASLKQRCTNPRATGYANYGGRGIKVCRRWAKSFVAFYADVGPRPSADHSLDRWPDNDGDYKPGNVRWATPAQQGKNKRSIRRVSYRGQTLALSEWARQLPIPYSALRKRLNLGWPVRRAFEAPIDVVKASTRTASRPVR